MSDGLMQNNIRQDKTRHIILNLPLLFICIIIADDFAFLIAEKANRIDWPSLYCSIRFPNGFHRSDFTLCVTGVCNCLPGAEEISESAGASFESSFWGTGSLIWVSISALNIRTQPQISRRLMTSWNIKAPEMTPKRDSVLRISPAIVGETVFWPRA